MSYTFEPPFDRPSKRRRGTRIDNPDEDLDHSTSEASSPDSDSSEDESIPKPFLPFDNDAPEPKTIPAGTSKNSGAKWHHINLLNAILHKSLQERNYDQASRAFGLLLRVEHRGNRLDLRKKGLWEIGAEIIEKRSITSLSSTTQPESRQNDTHNSQRDGNDDEDEIMRETSSQHPPQTLDVTDSNKSPEEQRLAAVQRYFNRLIRDYPYVRWRAQNVDERTFYPYMFEASIRETQVRTQNAINAITAAATTSPTSADAQIHNIPFLPRIALVPPPPDASSRSPTPLSESLHTPAFPPSKSSSSSSSGSSRSSSPGSTNALPFMPPDLPITPGTLLALSNVKQHELVAARQVSGKIAELIVSPPYDRHTAMLRLQSMVLTWTADLMGDIESLGRRREKIMEGKRREGVAAWVAGEADRGTEMRGRMSGEAIEGSGDEMDGVEGTESSESASDNESSNTGSVAGDSHEDQHDVGKDDDKAGQSHHLQERALNAVDMQLKDLTIGYQDRESERRTAEKIKDSRGHARRLLKRAEKIEKAAANDEETTAADEDDGDEKLGSSERSSAASDSE